MRALRGHRSLLVVCAVLITCAAIAVVGTRLLSGGPPSPLVSELEQLRDDQGLFFRPGLLAAGQPSISAGAYGLGVLHASGRPIVALPDTTTVRSLVHDAVAESSVWGPWYLLRIEEATQQPVPGDWYRDIASRLRPEGFFHDSAQAADDRTADLASTAVALEVMQSKHIALAPAQADAVASWVSATVDQLGNQYQACNALRSLRAVDRLTEPTRRRIAADWVLTPGRLPRVLDSFEGVLDLYGAACLMSDLGLGDPAPVRALLGTALSRPVDDLQLLYHVTAAWRLIGGSPADLAQLAAKAASRLDPGTGLMTEVVRPVGTLENSYYVTEIRRFSGLAGDDDRLAAGVRKLMAEHGHRYGPVSYLLTALVLRSAGQPDQAMQDHAVALARQRLTTPVTKDSVASWALMHQLLTGLAVAGPEAQVQPWPIETVADRGLAWLVLSQLQHVRGQDPPPGFAALTAAIPDTLATEAPRLSMIELRAGVAVLASAEQVDRIPVDALSSALNERRGCLGTPNLYRQTIDSRECDLRATADALWIQTFLHVKDAGGTS